MTEFTIRSFDEPDDAMEFPNARLELVRVGGNEVWRMTAEPGWRYSESMGPVEGTEMCEAEHGLWMMSSGTLAVRTADGTTKEFGPGETGSIPGGHEAWVVGDEPVVAFDVQPGGGDGQKRAATPPAAD
jgi:hypothetical protein